MNESKSSGGDQPSAPKPIISPSQVILLAIWFGVMTGFGEVGCQAFRKYVQGKLIKLPAEIVWMAPVADLGFFLSTGAILALASWALPKVFNLRTIVFLLSTQSFFFIVYNFDGLHSLAVLVLAAGLGTQSTRLAVRYPRGFQRLAGWTIGWFSLRRRPTTVGEPLAPLLDRRQVLVGSAGAVAGVAAAFHGWRWLTERRTVAALPAAPPGAPNVIFIVLDTVRAASLSLYGYARPTCPNLERLAQNGVCFLRAMAPAPWTLPSHAAMFTGRSLDETQVNYSQPYAAAYPTLAEVLGAHGYETAGFAANTFFLTHEYGLTRGFAHFQDYAYSPGQVIRASAVGNRIAIDERVRSLINHPRRWGYKGADGINGAFLRWLGRRQPDRPFFAFLNYMDAHDPYLPAPGFERRFGGRMPRDPWLHDRKYSDEEIVELRDAYDSCIAGLDDHLGQLLLQLGAAGALDNTVLIVTSDHGDHFGEHGLMGHLNSLYLPLLHVPLVVSWQSRIPAGTNTSRVVSLRDLPATVMQLVDLENRSPFPGKSWFWQNGGSAAVEGTTALAELEHAPAWRPAWWPNRKGPMKSVFHGNFHYILNGDGVEEVYDFERDPSESRNLAQTEQGRRDLPSLRASLRNLLVAQAARPACQVDL